MLLTGITNDPHIFVMVTVVMPKGFGGTLKEGLLRAHTVDIVQENRTGPPTKEGSCFCNSSRSNKRTKIDWYVQCMNMPLKMGRCVWPSMFLHTYLLNPAMAQTMPAALVSNMSSQTVPHVPFTCISTRPWLGFPLGSTRRRGIVGAET